MTDPEALIDAVAHSLVDYPQPEDAAIPDVPFPLASFPPQVADWLGLTASRARVPVALVAMPFLAFTGSHLGRQLALEVSPGWHERPALWVALVSPTGLGKTPALAAAREPFWRLHHERWQDWHDWSPGEGEERATRPSFDPLFVTTAGMAALARSLVTSPGLCLLRDELYGLIRSLDRHQGEDRQLFLSLWSSEPIFLDRPGSQPAILAPVVGLVGGLQPLLLERIRRRAQDGFLERFLLVYPTGRMDRWQEDEIAALPAPDTRGIVDLLRPLRTIPGAGETGRIVPRSPGAGAAWADWFNGNIDQHHISSPMVSGFYRKLPSHLARIALVLHALWQADDPTGPLAGETMHHAIALVEYLRVHDHRASIVLGDRSRPHSALYALSKRILRTLAAETKHEGWIGRSELLVALGRPERIRFDEAVAFLIERAVVISSTGSPGSTGRPLTSYRLDAKYRILFGNAT